MWSYYRHLPTENVSYTSNLIVDSLCQCCQKCLSNLIADFLWKITCTCSFIANFKFNHFRSTTVPVTQCFWLSHEYYDNAVKFYLELNPQTTSASEEDPQQTARWETNTQCLGILTLDYKQLGSLTKETFMKKLCRKYTWKTGYTFVHFLMVQNICFNYWISCCSSCFY